MPNRFAKPEDRWGEFPLELERLKAKETDCGVCGVPAYCMVEVCEGYAVPRCEDHRDMPSYQAEARLYSLLRLAPTPQQSDKDMGPPQGEGE